MNTIVNDIVFAASILINVFEAMTKWVPFVDDIFKSISLDYQVWIRTKISLKYVT